ncbi:acetyl-CoA C-acyltransferase [Nocardia tengchongensis]|uniref:acetyl-CoA C-acyltransferase n=1 Tax=Nocardia tengchongensis TaxID=2055889 RepID=UPI0036CFA37A
MSLDPALVFDVVRTPCGRGDHTGSLHSVRPIDLCAGLLREVTDRHPNLEPGRIGDVLLGTATPAGEQGPGFARAAVLAAGYPTTVPAATLERGGGGGLDAVNTAATRIRAGCADLMIAGGVESASRVPTGSASGGWTVDLTTGDTLPAMPRDTAADLLATLTNLTRAQLDAWVARSHRNAAVAESSQWLAPVRDLNGTVVLDRDELVQPTLTARTLSQLPPVREETWDYFDVVALQRFHWLNRIERLHTPASLAADADAAAVVLLGSAAAANAHGLIPRARILATAVAADDYTLALTAGAAAARIALERAGIGIDTVDCIEIAEPCAAVVLHTARELEIELDQVNVTGGALATGYPAGAAGAMLIGGALTTLAQTNGRYGLCVCGDGDGTGVATVIERI